MNRLRVVCIVLLALAIWPVAAQRQGKRPGNPDRVQSRMISATLQEMKGQLGLNEAQMEQLAPVYTQFQKKLFRLNMQTHRFFYRLNADTTSNDFAQSALKEYLERDKKVYNLNKKFVEDISAFLTPQQIIKLYQTDMDVRSKVRKEFQRRNQ